jgi:hypothetical protein
MAKIVASNNKEYDLDNLQPHEEQLLIQLGHLPSNADANTEGVAQSLMVEENQSMLVEEYKPTNDEVTKPKTVKNK